MFTTTTFNDLRDAIMLWAQDITGRLMILANAGTGPKGNVPYILGFITLSEIPNFQNSTISDDGLVETIRAISVVSVQLDFYGGNAMQGDS